MTHFLYMYHQSASQSTTALVLITSVDSVSVSGLIRSSRLEAMKARLQAAQDLVRVDRLSFIKTCFGGVFTVLNVGWAAQSEQNRQLFLRSSRGRG